MINDFYQAVYAHTDSGWAVIHTPDNMPKKLKDDFAIVERVNAGDASGGLVPMGNNETPSCMFEIYFKGDAAGLVRVQYGLSDVQGRPVSFAHGYIFPDAYTLLKKPEDILNIKKENFADQRITEEEKSVIRSTPGDFNKALIAHSGIDDIPHELLREDSFSLKNAFKICGLSIEAYYTYIFAIYTYILSSNAEKNLYIKTDGSENYAWNLLYLTYSAIPYSMRTKLSASICLHAGQHNTKLIFCAELPENMPQINPISGENNVMSDAVMRRIRDRNPFIMSSVNSFLKGRHEHFFNAIEARLCLMGNEKLNSMQALNLAYSFAKKEYEISDRLPGIIYGWCSLPVTNSCNWEEGMSFLLKKARDQSISVGKETIELLSSRLENAVTEQFKNEVRSYLTLCDSEK